MTQTNILERAKTGDTVAIETILNDLLRIYDVTAKVGLKHHCLYIVLAAAEIPKQAELIRVIRQQILDLSIEAVQNVKIYVAVWGQEGQAWHDEFNLTDSDFQINPNSDSSQDEVESGLESHQGESQNLANQDLAWQNLPLIPSEQLKINISSDQDIHSINIESNNIENSLENNIENNIENHLHHYQTNDIIGSLWDDNSQVDNLDKFLQVGSHLLKLSSPSGISLEKSLNQHPQNSHHHFSPRSTPICKIPPALLYLIGRVEEVNQGILGLQSGQSLEFYSKSGLGKSAIIRHLCHCLDLNTIGKDGIFSFYARHQPVEDILQAIFYGFYETKSDYKPTPEEITTLLATLEALIIIDDNHLASAQMCELQQKLPRCQLILASSHQRLHDHAVSIQLPGLSLGDARTLVTQELQRPLTNDEIEALGQLANHSEAVNQTENHRDRSIESEFINQDSIIAHPWLLKLAISFVQTTNQTFADLQTQLRHQRPDIGLIKLVLRQLTPPEYATLEVLAAMGGVAMLAAQISEISGITEIEPILERLVISNLVQIEGDRYRVHDYLVELITEIEAKSNHQRLERIRDRALTYFSGWAKMYRSLPGLVISEADAIMEMLAWGVSRGKWQEVLNIGVAFEPILITTKMWGLWQIVLDYILKAARHLDDKATWGWVLHQQGTRLLCLGEYSQAKESLEIALQIRKVIKDTQGLAVTQSNLNQIPSQLVVANAIQPHVPKTSSLELKNPERQIDSIIKTTTNPYLSLRVWLIRSLFLGMSGVITYFAWSMLTQLDTMREAKSPNSNVSNVKANNNSLLSTSTEKIKVSLSQSSIDFGTMTINGEQPQQKLTITNHSSVPLRISELEKTGENSDFRLNLSSCSSIIAPNERCHLSISFVPIDDGKHTARIKIIDSDSNVIQAVAIAGIARKPSLPAEFSSPPPLTIMIDEPLQLPSSKPTPRPKVKVIPLMRSPIGSPSINVDPIPSQPIIPTVPTPNTPEATEIPQTPETSEPTPTETPELTPVQPPQFIPPTPQVTPTSSLPIQTITPEATPSPMFSMESNFPIPTNTQ